MEEQKTSNRTPMLIGIGLVVLLLLIGGAFLLKNFQKTSPHPSSVSAGQLSIARDNQSAVMGQQIIAPEVSPTSQAVSAGQTKEFTVTGENFSFDPQTISVNKGDTVKITFKNADGFHNWVLDEFNAKTKTIRAGQQDVVQFVADKTGTFEYYCSVGNHQQMGMVGKLIVQ